MQVFRSDSSEAESLIKLENFVTDNLHRIQKRLGGERHKMLVAKVPAAIDDLRNNRPTVVFNEIVNTLLHEYYDPLYAHKMVGREQQVVFSGSAEEIADWIDRVR